MRILNASKFNKKIIRNISVVFSNWMRDANGEIIIRPFLLCPWLLPFLLERKYLKTDHLE